MFCLLREWQTLPFILPDRLHRFESFLSSGVPLYIPSSIIKWGLCKRVSWYVRSVKWLSVHRLQSLSFSVNEVERMRILPWTQGKEWGSSDRVTNKIHSNCIFHIVLKYILLPSHLIRYRHMVFPDLQRDSQQSEGEDLGFVNILNPWALWLVTY